MNPEEIELLDAELEEHLYHSNNRQWKLMSEVVESAKKILGEQDDIYYIAAVAQRVPGVEMDFFTVTISNYKKSEVMH